VNNQILIIDDDADDREIIGTNLKNAGFENIMFAKDGEEGLELANQMNPDIVVTDTRLPGLDGFEVCRRIKEALGEKVKVIIMTGLVDAIDAVKAREMSADDYCVKTSNSSVLIEAIQKIIKQS